jgi:hypothetical protein
LHAQILSSSQALTRENLNAADESKAILRLEELMPIIRAQTAKADGDKKEKAKAEKADKQMADAAAGISATNVAEKKKRGRKHGKKTGLSRDLADQHGVDQKTVLAAKRRAKAMGETPDEQKVMLTRIAAQPQFDKPSAVDALAAMEPEKREAIVAAAERGEKIKVTQKPTTKANPIPHPCDERQVQVR